MAQRRGFTFDGDGHVLPRQPLRLVLADDPGAGKTIMAGLYIKERHLLLMTGTPHAGKEVKGRIAGADTVSVSRSQILHGLNVPDRFVLALVSVSPDSVDGDEVRHVREPFTGLTLGFAQTRAVFDWHALWQRGEPPLGREVGMNRPVM